MMPYRVAIPLFAIGLACGKHAAEPAKGSAAATPPVDAQPVALPTGWDEAWKAITPATATDFCPTFGAPKEGVAIAVPATIKQLTAVTRICFTSGGLTELPAELATLPHLESLEIANQRLRTLPDLSRLTTLRYLTIDATPTLDLASLILPKQLDGLAITHGKLTAVPANVWTAALTHLDLSNNALEMLPPAVFALAHLVSLNVDGNRLTRLAGVEKLHELVFLHASDNKLAELPPTAFDNHTLGQIYISNNPLTKLPGIERSGPLDIEVKRVPFEPAEHDRLVALQAERSNLRFDGLETPATSLDAALADPAHTYALDLSAGKPIGKLAPTIGKLVELRTLILDHQQLRELPQALAALKHLRTLSLRDNAFDHVPSAVATLAELRTLDLDNNAITALPDELGALGELRELYVARNQLAALPAALGKLAHLRILDADDNHLASLPPELGGLGELDELWLWGNALTSVPPEIIKLPKITAIVVDGNPNRGLPDEVRNKHDGWLTTAVVASGPLSGQNCTPAYAACAWSDHALDPRTRAADLSEGRLDLDELVKPRRLRTLIVHPTPAGIDVTGHEPPTPPVPLEEVPVELGELTALATLGLAGHKLRAVPSSLGKLHRLRELDLSGNDLRAVPPFVYQLDAITNLADNPHLDAPDTLQPILRFKLDGKAAAIVVGRSHRAETICPANLEVELVKLAARPVVTVLAEVVGCNVTIGRAKAGELARALAPELDWHEAITWKEQGRSLSLALPTKDPAPLELAWDEHGKPVVSQPPSP